MKNIKVNEEVVDLTDDTTYGTETQDIEIVSETRAGFHRARARRRRRRSNNSDVVIVDDQGDVSVNKTPPIQHVACHIFYPEDDVGAGEGYDPLAPVPEWVDCSSLQSEQVSENQDLVAKPDESATSLAFVDPLSVAESAHCIKTEPITEVDVKPSLEQLAETLHPENNDCSVLRKIDNNKIVSCKSEESINNSCDIITKNNNKRKESLVDMNDSIPEKKKRKIGPKCALFRQKGMTVNTNQSNEANSESNLSVISQTNHGSKKIGPKCVKVKQKERSTSEVQSKHDMPLMERIQNEDSLHTSVKISTKKAAETNKSSLHTFQSDNKNVYLNEIKSTKYSSKKVGPKCAKFRMGEKSNSDSSNLSNFSITSPPIGKKVIGPKCAKLRFEERENSGESSSNTTKKIGPKCAKFRLEERENSDVSSSNTAKKIGSKCAKFRLDERENSDASSSNTTKKIGFKCAKFRLDERENSDASSSIITQKIGPKCAKLRLEERRNSDVSSTNTIKKIGPKCAKFKREEIENSDASSTNTTKKIGPKCAKFRLEERKNLDASSTNTTKKIGPKCAKFKMEEIENSDASSTNTTKKIGPKCAKFRMEEQKSSDLPSLHGSSDKTKGTEQKYIIKPAVVAVGPKLPLPQCFQQKNTPYQEAARDSRVEVTENHDDELANGLDQDHIVLKIYTCFKCNHKCTDPLFHEEHMKRCNVKLRSKSLILPQYIKNTQIYKCQICTFKFSKEENANRHMASHGDQGFLCHICQIIFPTIYQLNQHTLNEHKNMEKVFSCNICDYSSLNVYYLKDHMIKHNEDKYLYCTLCKRNYEDAEDIDNHLEKVHKMSRTKRFKMNETKQHGNTVEKEKDVKKSESKEWPGQAEASKTKTNDSNKHFEDIDDIASVIEKFDTQVIAGNGKYHCNGCCYQFVALKNLYNHKKYHIQNKPFSCCDGSFVTFSYVDLSKHVQGNHCNSELNCSMCPSTFTKSSSLAEHMVKHIDDGLFCLMCQKNFETSEVYENHIAKLHSGNSIVCTECPFSTDNSEYFKKHMARHSKIKKDQKLMTAIKPSETVLNSEIKNSKTKNDSKMIISSECTDDELSLDSRISSFSCSICSCKLNSMDALQKHMKNDHEKNDSKIENDYNCSIENEAFKCRKCSFKSLQPSLFIEHMKYGHKKFKFVCNVCRTSFAFLKFYLNHMQNHAACAVIYSCNECRYSSKKKQVFAKHMRTHSLKACPLCDYKTLKLTSLEAHLESIHTVDNECSPTQHINTDSFAHTSNQQSCGTSANGKSHNCCFCAFVSTDIDSLRDHMAVHFIKQSGSDSGKVLEPSLSEAVSTDTDKKVLPKIYRDMNINIGHSFLYSCTKCDYKKKDRSTVACHFLKKHGFRGSVKENTIKKIFVPKPADNRAETKNGKEKGLNKPFLSSVNERRLSGDSNQIKKDKNDSMNHNQMDQSEIEGSGKPLTNEKYRNASWSCKSCDFQKLSLLAQVQHRKFGHLGFWKRPFWCKICGFRSADKRNLNKHFKWKHNSENLKKNLRNIKALESKIGMNSEKTPCQEALTTVASCDKCNIEILSESAQNQHETFGHDTFWNRPFSCDVCGMRFLFKCYLTLHNKTHKSNHTKLSKKKQKTPCMERKKVPHTDETTLQINSFSTIKEDPENKELSSDDDEVYVCGECDFVTRSVIQFSTHMFIHSGIPDD